jgi:hypothetical protein
MLCERLKMMKAVVCVLPVSLYSCLLRHTLQLARLCMVALKAFSQAAIRLQEIPTNPIIRLLLDSRFEKRHVSDFSRTVLFILPFQTPQDLSCVAFVLASCVYMSCIRQADGYNVHVQSILHSIRELVAANHVLSNVRVLHGPSWQSFQRRCFR